jgi:hypothetical protein
MMLAKAFSDLYTASRDSLSTEQLESLENLVCRAESDAESLSRTLAAFGGILLNEDKSYHPSDEQLAHVFFTLSSQAANIGAMICVGSDADYLANKRKTDGQ